MTYMYCLRQHDKVLEKLKQFEARLGKFCYSIYTLEPKPYLCKVEGDKKLNDLRGKGVYSVSNSPPLALQERNIFYEIKTNFTAFGAREKRMSDHLHKRYIVRKKLNDTEAIARNQASKYFGSDMMVCILIRTLRIIFSYQERRQEQTV